MVQDSFVCHDSIEEETQHENTKSDKDDTQFVAGLDVAQLLADCCPSGRALQILKDFEGVSEDKRVSGLFTSQKKFVRRVLLIFQMIPQLIVYQLEEGFDKEEATPMF